MDKLSGSINVTSPNNELDGKRKGLLRSQGQLSQVNLLGSFSKITEDRE